jgi:hypothetical protein
VVFVFVAMLLTRFQTLWRRPSRRLVNLPRSKVTEWLIARSRIAKMRKDIPLHRFGVMIKLAEFDWDVLCSFNEF